MKFPIFQVDAFTDTIFGGNPAAVMPLNQWLPEQIMQHIAMENNLSETAFYVQEHGAIGLRWFTPELEIDLCGHATLATAHVLFSELGVTGNELQFDTRSGRLRVRKKGDGYIMNFPSDTMNKVNAPAVLFQALGIPPTNQVFKSDDYMIVLDKEEEVASIHPDSTLLKTIEARGIIVTAPGDTVDFVSRFFCPQVGIDEDPVTGSAHTKLAPYWANRLEKNQLHALQISSRQGELRINYLGERVEIEGKAITFLRGEVEI